MAEYTEREKVCELLDTISSDIEDIPEGGLPREYINGWQDALETAIYKIRNIPTSNVQHERHGEWSKEEFGCDFSKVRAKTICFFKCSLCGHLSFEQHANYCPHCGAKMIGGINKNADTV